MVFHFYLLRACHPKYIKVLAIQLCLIFNVGPSYASSDWRYTWKLSCNQAHHTQAWEPHGQFACDLWGLRDYTDAFRTRHTAPPCPMHALPTYALWGVGCYCIYCCTLAPCNWTLMTHAHAQHFREETASQIQKSFPVQAPWSSEVASSCLLLPQPSPDWAPLVASHSFQTGKSSSGDQLPAQLEHHKSGW